MHCAVTVTFYHTWLMCRCVHGSHADYTMYTCTKEIFFLFFARKVIQLNWTNWTSGTSPGSWAEVSKFFDVWSWGLLYLLFKKNRN